MRTAQVQKQLVAPGWQISRPRRAGTRKYNMWVSQKQFPSRNNENRHRCRQFPWHVSYKL